MRTQLWPVFVFVLLLAAPAQAVERVEIVLDMSAEMWKDLGDGTPVFITLREALADFSASAAQRQGRPEVSLRIVGGGKELTDGDWCSDTHLLFPFAITEPESYREALADLLPSGGRPLVRGLEEAITDLEGYEDRRRIVIITAGSDQCHGEVIKTIETIVASEPPIELRIIGIGLDRSVANAATTLAPTHNLFDLETLADTLKWALQPADTRPPVASRSEIRLTYGGEPVASAEIELTDASGSERAYAAIENGSARVRVTAGRYLASIQLEQQRTVVLPGLVLGGSEDALQLDLLDLPPVTLETFPERPLAGGPVQISYWGAPTGNTWIALAVPDSTSSQYLVRARVFEAKGEAAFVLPESTVDLEARCITEVQPGVFQILGSHRFSGGRPNARLDSPESIEDGTPIKISWTGPGHDGDHVTIAPAGGDSSDYFVCLPVGAESGELMTRAPAATGDYVVSYRSRMGRILDRRPLQVFEVLATLEGPDEVNPLEDVEISWTGPDEPQDFLSLTEPESPDQAYLSWAPTRDGSPARFQAPHDAGEYEIRYIRSSDGAILARFALEVRDAEYSLTFPDTVAAGTRFDVQWTGTARSGDFLTVAEAGSGASESIDFSYAVTGSPLSLAAPFEPGDYEIRYISGANFEILALETITVR